MLTPVPYGRKRWGGKGAFVGYINYSLDKKEKAKAAEIEKVTYSDKQHV